MGIGLPPPVERPNPYATFVRTFLQARDAQRQYKEDQDRLALAKEEEKARREAEKVAKEQWKEQQDLRNSEFEFQKLDSERKFKQSELAHKWERAQSFRNMRNPTPGKPFSLQLPMGVDEAPMDVAPVTYDDLQTDRDADRQATFQNQLQLHNTPEPTPLPITLPQNLNLNSMAGQSVDPRVLGVAASRANNQDSIAAMNERGDRDRAPTVLRDTVGNVTGILNRQSGEIMPVGGGQRTAAVPQGEFGKLDEGVAALTAIDAVKQGIEEFQKTSLMDPIDKAMAGMRLNNTATALSRTVGRNMGEKGVFTDQDKADFTRFLGPGIVLSTLSPAEQTKRITLAENLMKKLIKYRVNTFYQRYGSLPEDKMQFLDKPTPGVTPGTKPNSLRLPLP